MSAKPATAQCRVILRGFLIAAMGSVAASCSSDAMRFTDKMYTAAIPQTQPNGQVVGVVSQPIVQSGLQAQQAFPSQLPTVTPSNIDYTTTASVQRRAIINRVMSAIKPVPVGIVGARNRLAPQPILVGPAQPTISYQAPTIQPVAAPIYRPVVAAPTLPRVQPVTVPKVQTAALPTPVITPVVVPTPAPVQTPVLSQVFPAAPKVEPITLPQTPQVTVSAPSSNNLLPSTVDMQTTGSIRPVAPQSAPVTTAAVAQPGWSTANASRVTLKSGETVYNLSRRFGVPADVIYKVNGLQNNAPVQAGQTLIIPIYQYGAAAPISAPDANPETKLAKSTSGSILDLPDRDAPQPMPRPFYQIAVLPQTPQLRERKPVETPNVIAAPTPSAAPSAAPIVAAPSPTLSGKSYRVVSGDSLYGIARKHGVTVTSLKSANQLGSGYLKVGQTLRIPQGGETTAIISQPAIKPTAPQKVIKNVDPILTGSTPTSVQKVEAQTSAVSAPATSGVSRLRMPVQGRVVTGFKARENGRSNDGIDIAVPKGTSVRAAENGVVIYSGEGLSEYGRTVLIRHDDGLVTVYGHADQLKVQRGQKVKRGQEIALSGMTGEATRPKLHFEVRKNTVPVDPSSYLN